MVKLLFPGGTVFWLAEKLYISLFDYFQRQTSFTSRFLKPIISSTPNDWENPKVIGKKRRKAHCSSKSFSNRKAANDYWEQRKVNPLLQFQTENIVYLTGFAGEPDDSGPWKFQLIGDPTSSPLGWEGIDYHSDNTDEWVSVSLPNHWQLQGFDVPIYTNTT